METLINRKSSEAHSELQKYFRLNTPEELWHGQRICQCDFSILADYCACLAASLERKRVNCLRCGSGTFSSDFYYARQVTEASQAYLDGIWNGESSLWHMTKTRNWGERYQSFEEIHCGNLLTAFSRGCNILRDNNWSKSRVDSFFSLYEIRVNPKKISRELWVDTGNFWSVLDSGDAFPYFNDVEFPGSASVYAHSSTLEIVGVSRVDVAEMVREVSEITWEYS